MWYSCKSSPSLSSSVPTEIFIHPFALTSPGSTLTLIGSVHSDNRCAATLAELLAGLNPDQLTVEIPPEAISYRQTHGVLLLRKLEMILAKLEKLDPAGQTSFQQHPDIVAIRNLLDLPYEFRVASTHARGKGINLHAIDAAELSLAKLRQVEESLITLPHIRRITSSPGITPTNHAQSYELARQLLSSPPVGMRQAFLSGCRGEEGIGRRDRYLAGKIRTLLQSQPGHLVHIGGWVHLIDDPAGETLYSLLSDLKPRPILLDPDHPVIP